MKYLHCWNISLSKLSSWCTYTVETYPLVSYHDEVLTLLEHIPLGNCQWYRRSTYKFCPQSHRPLQHTWLADPEPSHTFTQTLEYPANKWKEYLYSNTGISCKWMKRIPLLKHWIICNGEVSIWMKHFQMRHKTILYLIQTNPYKFIMAS